MLSSNMAITCSNKVLMKEFYKMINLTIQPLNHFFKKRMSQTAKLKVFYLLYKQFDIGYLVIRDIFLESTLALFSIYRLRITTNIQSDFHIGLNTNGKQAKNVNALVISPYVFIEFIYSYIHSDNFSQHIFSHETNLHCACVRLLLTLLDSEQCVLQVFEISIIKYCFNDNSNMKR